jgi:hypothetical protein
MGQLLSFPKLLTGVLLLFLARQWQQPSGNFQAQS